MPSETRIPLLFGAGNVGQPGSDARVVGAKTVQKFIDIVVKHGQYGVDTSNIYAGGTSEQVISELDLKGLALDTKVYPIQPGDHSPAKLRELFSRSEKALGAQKIRVFYLHAPDRAVPYEDTLEVINELYQQGKFQEFGLSKFASWEVAEVVGICKRRGFVRPTVYQGPYNLVDRSVETELFPCLRKFGLKFAAYSPLAGGFLTGKHLGGAAPEPGSHFDPKWTLGFAFIGRYQRTEAVVAKLKAAAEKHGLRLPEVAARWLQHHSLLVPEDHGIIFGASTPEQLEAVFVESAKGPLPEELVKVCDEAWVELKGRADNYFA